MGQFESVFGDAAAADQQRTIHALLVYDQVVCIAHAVAGAPEIRNARPKLQHLRRNKLNTMGGQTGQGLAILFELELASRMLRSLWEVQFAEPDIVLTIPDVGSAAIACKRPRAPHAIGRNIREAGQQIARSGLEGVVVMTVDGFAPTFVKGARTAEDLAKAGNVWLDKLVEDWAGTIADAFDNSVSGVIFIHRFAGMVKQPSSFRWTLCTKRVPNLEQPYGYAIAELLDRAIRQLPDSFSLGHPAASLGGT